MSGDRDIEGIRQDRRKNLDDMGGKGTSLTLTFEESLSELRIKNSSTGVWRVQWLKVLTACLRVSVVIKHSDQSNLDRKGLFQLTTCNSSYREIRARTPGRKLEAGTDAEAVKEKKIDMVVLARR